MLDHWIIRIPQTPSWPDLPPRDVDFFDMLKNRLEQIQVCDADDFFGQLDEILSSILAQELERVFAA
jgi:hypothetical protein